MKCRNIFTLALTALVISMLTFSCTQDSNEITAPPSPEIPLLKEKLPEVHELIDFSSYINYDFVSDDGRVIPVKGYEAKEHGVVIGYYLEIEDRISFIGVTEKNMVRTDLLNDEQIIAPMVYNSEFKRLMPKYDRLLLAPESLDSEIARGDPDCHDLCHAAHVLCGEACLLAQQIAYEWTDIDNAVVYDLTLQCINACYAAVRICRDLCDA